MADYKLRLPKPAKMEEIRQTLVEDEDFRFGKLKLGNDEIPRFAIPCPTDDDPDNIANDKSFIAVVVVAKPNFFKDKENPEAEPKERRALYLLRAGVAEPTDDTPKQKRGTYNVELLYISPTALRPWKELCGQFVNGCAAAGIPAKTPYYHVLVKFSGERVHGKKFTWNKPKFEIVGKLSAAEIAYIEELRPLVDGRIRDYESNENLDRYEEEALSGTARVVEDPQAAHSKAVAHDIDKDEEEAAPAAVTPKATRTQKPKEQPAAAPKAEPEPAKEPEAPKVTIKDDEDEVKKTETPKSKDDDDETETPPPARRRVSISDDD